MIDKELQNAFQLAGFHAQGKNPAAVALGSLTSKKKAQASRENGKKGGRPKRVPPTH